MRATAATRRIEKHAPREALARHGERGALRAANNNISHQQAANDNHIWHRRFLIAAAPSRAASHGSDSKTYAYGTANAKTETYTYDLAGRLKTTTDAKGQVLTLVRNKDDSIASYAYTNAVIATPGASFTYDSWYPRRTGMTDQFGTTTWTYKAVGTNGATGLDTEDGPFGNDSVTYGYDTLGRINSRSVGGATAETLGYDLLGRMNAHTTDLGSFTYGYLGNSGQVSTRTIGGITTTWGYDTNANDRRLLTISTTGAVARNFTYASNAYQITGITDTPAATHPWLGQSWSFSYDGSDRLLTGNGTIAGNSSFSYDKLDNATSFAGATANYNNLNQVNAWNSNIYTHDANGNLTSGDGVKTYTYDAADRLIRINYTGSTAKTEFGYDGLGRRLTMTETPATGSPTTTRFLWCGDMICQTRSGTDVVQVRYFVEGEYRLSGALKYLYLHDRSENVRDVINLTGGALVGAFDYKPFGEIGRSWGTVTPGYLYGGLYYHATSGLYLSTTRFYDAKTGRWLGRDPKRELGDPSQYAYARLNPLKFTDRDGRESGLAQAVPIIRGGMSLAPQAGAAGAAIATFCSDGPLTCIAVTVVAIGGVCVAIYDKAGNKVSPVAGSLAPPGDCNDDAYEKLKNSYESNCSAQAAPACARGDTATIITEKIGAHSRCIDARKKIMEVCFRGGDDGHKEQVDSRISAIRNCQRLYIGAPN